MPIIMKPWLLLDAHYLAWRAFYAMGNLSHNGMETGVLYGFFKDVLSLTDLFLTPRVAFAFDSRKSKRRDELACYKTSREDKYKQATKEEQRMFRAMRKQIRNLRTEYLPALGYKNILYQVGYEADDLIASAVKNLPANRTAIIVSRDADLYQLLGPRVIMYDPHKKTSTTEESFSRTHGIEAAQWPDVKAIAGCKTDDVPGVEGVGEKTAVKFLSGTLKEDSVAFRKIVKLNHVWRRNLPVVTLPYPGTETVRLVKDGPSDPEKWDTLMESLGMSSLFGRRPQRARKGFGFK